MKKTKICISPANEHPYNFMFWKPRTPTLRRPKM